uniref:CIZ1 C2H2-type zinc finger domain-containing protein n=1 Tax=Timema monikensis TaxID=170555 RepID=A0A7R9EAS5_9NEOP|nr:unnamed protein product [Timema monikensis]
MLGLWQRIRAWEEITKNLTVLVISKRNFDDNFFKVADRCTLIQAKCSRAFTIKCCCALCWNSKEAPDKTKDDAEKKKIISKYAGVPDMLFFCHICNKHLWDAQVNKTDNHKPVVPSTSHRPVWLDGTALTLRRGQGVKDWAVKPMLRNRTDCFDKHLTGRPHTETFDRQREGYKRKTVLLRKKLKLNTEKMELELDTPQLKKPRIQQFCAMCDTHYYGGVVLHRRTWDHQGSLFSSERSPNKVSKGDMKLSEPGAYPVPDLSTMLCTCPCRSAIICVASLILLSSFSWARTLSLLFSSSLEIAECMAVVVLIESVSVCALLGSVSATFPLKAWFGVLIAHPPPFGSTPVPYKIKSFMHPYCLICRKDFQARVDWDRHKLSAGHLKKVVNVLKERKGSSNDVFTIDDFIFAESEDYEDEFSELEMKVRSREDEEKDILKRQDKQEQDTAVVSTIAGEETNQPKMEGVELGTEDESKGDKEEAKEDPKVSREEEKQESNGKEDPKVSREEEKQESNGNEDPKVSREEEKQESNGNEDHKMNGDEAKEDHKENVDSKKNGDEIKENPPSNKKKVEHSIHLFKYDPDQIVGCNNSGLKLYSVFQRNLVRESFYIATKSLSGAAMLKPSRGLMCEVCRVFIKGEGHAKSHCSSLTHYNYYLAHMMAQDSREKMRAAKQAEQSALEKAKSLVVDSDDNKVHVNTDIQEEATQEKMDTEEPSQDKEEQGDEELGDKEEPGDQEETEQQDIGIDEDKEV